MNKEYLKYIKRAMVIAVFSVVVHAQDNQLSSEEIFLRMKHIDALTVSELMEVMEIYKGMSSLEEEEKQIYLQERGFGDLEELQSESERLLQEIQEQLDNQTIQTNNGDPCDLNPALPVCPDDAA